MGALVLMMTGTLMAKAYYETSEDMDFNYYGQYDPKYIEYSHEQMLKACEKHNLIYDYENGECQTKAERDQK